MAEEEGAGEVRIKLVADDLSSAVVAKVKQGMEDIRKESEKARDATGEKGLSGEIFKGLAKFELMKKSAELVGESIHAAFEATKELAEAALEAASAQDQQVRAMSGSAFLMDQGKHSMKDLMEYSKGVREEFAKTGIEQGVATKAIADAYGQLIKHGTMGTEKAKVLAEQMAVVGKVVPGGMESLASGFSALESGRIGRHNPVVQLIAATHTLEGNAKSVGKQMEKMTPIQQIDLATAAIKKQAEMLKDMGADPSLDQLKTSFEDVKESFLESMGEPMKEKLIPHLVDLRKFLIANADKIQEFATKMGKEIGKVVDAVDAMIEGLYEGFKQDWGEIKSMVDDIFGVWTEGWNSAIQDTHSIKSEFREIADDMKILMDPILRALKTAAELLMQAGDVMAGNPLGTNQYKLASRAVDAEKMGATTDTKKLERAILDMQDHGASIVGAHDVLALGDLARERAQMQIAKSQDAKNAFEANDTSVGFDNENAAVINGYMDDAIATNNVEFQRYYASLVETHQWAKNAIVGGALNIKGGFEDLIKVIGEVSPKLAEELKKLKGGGVGKGGITPQPGNAIFNGANFHITQDFKNMDPDRIMAVFKRDISKQAASRIASRVSTPFSPL